MQNWQKFFYLAGLGGLGDLRRRVKALVNTSCRFNDKVLSLGTDEDAIFCAGVQEELGQIVVVADCHRDDLNVRFLQLFAGPSSRAPKVLTATVADYDKHLKSEINVFIPSVYGPFDNDIFLFRFERQNIKYLLGVFSPGALEFGEA